VLLGMMWKRTTAAGGFWGLLAGSVASVAMFLLVKFNHNMLAVIALSSDAKDMAENMYRALWSWLICVIVTVAVSYFTKPKPVEELTGLVYGCTKLPSEGDLPLWKRPVFWAAISMALFLILQWIFW
jgi:SSS family solute:Na+ symporter